MTKKLTVICCVAILAAAVLTPVVQAEAPYLHPLRRAQMSNWNANYVHSAYGYPVALVVPPTAQLQTNWSWGAPSTSISRIDHQFGRDYVGPSSGAGYRRTPLWPSSTHQFGVYYVRAPWYPTQR